MKRESSWIPSFIGLKKAGANVSTLTAMSGVRFKVMTDEMICCMWLFSVIISNYLFFVFRCQKMCKTDDAKLTQWPPSVVLQSLFADFFTMFCFIVNLKWQHSCTNFSCIDTEALHFHKMKTRVCKTPYSITDKSCHCTTNCTCATPVTPNTVCGLTFNNLRTINTTL